LGNFRAQQASSILPLEAHQTAAAIEHGNRERRQSQASTFSESLINNDGRMDEIDHGQ
jgi:hypothetical protein